MSVYVWKALRLCSSERCHLTYRQVAFRNCAANISVELLLLARMHGHEYHCESQGVRRRIVLAYWHLVHDMGARFLLTPAKRKMNIFAVN